MKDFFEQPAADTTGTIPANKAKQGKLYVAYLNQEMISGNPANKEQQDSIMTRTYRASVLSTSGGSYYVDGIPVILSHDEEAILYEEELSEFY